MIAGTPGTGKSTLAEQISQMETGMELVKISELAKQRGLLDGFDEERNCGIIDEDQVGFIIVV